ncbi:MAG: T9SS type A sorting domain-containing protein, partial [Flavitalea sp.]
IENDEIFPATYRISYIRTSTISGPGLNPTLVSSYSKNYGPYYLAESDGNYFSGADYLITARDTVLNKKKLEETVSSNITPFLGYGTVSYNYNLSTLSRITGGGNYLGGPLTNDIIDFTLTYSYCPTTVLATGLKTFNAELGEENKVNLNWTADSEESGTAYTTEISRNGKDFSQISRILSEGSFSTRYSADYQVNEQDPSRLYFRIKRTDRQGKYSYSEIRQINISTQGLITLSTYPNPATKRVTVDFGKSTDGNMLVEIRDPAGKTYQRSIIRVSHSRSLDINLVNMPSGLYFLQTTDQKTGKRYISRLAVSQ